MFHKCLLALLACMFCTSTVHAITSDSIVNTESFEVIDETGADIYLQFGDTLQETIRFEIGTDRFVVSNDFFIQGDLSASGSITINADAIGDAVLTFGNAATNQTITFEDSTGIFSLSSSATVLGSITASSATLTELANCSTVSTNADGTLQCGSSSGVSLAPYLVSVSPSIFSISTAGVTLTIAGDNFDESTTFDFGSPNITINSTTVNSPTEAVLNVDIGATEQVHTITALNSGTSNFGTATFESKNLTVLTPGDGTTNWVSDVGVITGLGTLAPSGADGWNKGASFGTVPVSTDFTLTFEYTGPATNAYGMFGVDNSDPNQNYNTIDYAVYITNGSSVSVYENGTFRGSFGAVSVGDKFQIMRSGTTVTYHQNESITPFYTSTVPSSSSLVFDSSIFRNATIGNIQISY